MLQQKFKSFCFLVSVTLAFNAQSLDWQSLETFKNEFKSALQSQPKYMGLKNGYQDHGRGTNCQKSSDWWFSWESQIGDVFVDVDSENATIQAKIEFLKPEVQGGGFRTGGILCTPMGGSGRARMDNVNLSFNIKRKGQGDNAKPIVHIEELVLSGLKLDRVDLAIPFFYLQNGNAPEWFNEFLEKSSNKIIGSIIGSALGRRIDAKLSDKIIELINRFEHEKFSRRSDLLTLK